MINVRFIDDFFEGIVNKVYVSLFIEADNTNI